MTRIIARARRLVGVGYRRALQRCPDWLTVWFRPPGRRFALGEVPRPVVPPGAGVRLYIAPANFAAQGFALARAVERLPDVGAVSMQPLSGQDYGFPADYEIPMSAFISSGTWGRGQRDAVSRGFTHVLVEAERSVFGAAFDRDVEKELLWLIRRGLSVALISHGTDLRLPSRHAESDEWSPFRGRLDEEWVRRLEETALRNRELGQSLGTPLYVSTPELLLDWPSATWLPVIVDPGTWATDSELLIGRPPVVVHAPTSPIVKGTNLIEPTLMQMSDRGALDYRRIERVPAAAMPSLYAAADIVLDQFALGAYGTTSIEAMAAGRLVVAHLHEQVRSHIAGVTGLEPPIVEATPDTLGAVLDDIIARPQHYREIAGRGPEYVAAVHDGTLSTRVIVPFLTGAEGASRG
ncbi:hypothetical protein [Microbacterium abyssi]|uniref:hypothetical protein n=1 Tax=Microbacterium abyssi TaxID=2782166 RepID=UPI001888982D|nr:hypothetical protein [Microbacterium sp. A18JL241]